MTREEIISALVVDMMNTISEGNGWYLSSICENGFIGFANYTDEELAQEYAELFENNNLEQG